MGTFAMRISDELKTEINTVKERSGANYDQLMAEMLAAYKERQQDIDTTSPVFTEKQKVSQALSQVETVVGAYLELAAADKQQAENKAEEEIKKAQEQVSILTTKLQTLEKINSEMVAELKSVRKEKDFLKEKNENTQELKNIVSTLAEQIDSLKAVKMESNK